MMDAEAKRKRHAKPLELKALDYDGNSQDVRLLAGTPIIARINNKGMDIYNNETYTIVKIQPTLGTILATDGTKKLEIKFGDFQRLFRPAYCITIHCSQGKTFDSPYSIHEWSRLDPRLKYVALSRSTCKQNINVC
jgi:ATP-dependent exoDNAse (exonuclease V) alpha subunit